MEDDLYPCNKQERLAFGRQTNDLIWMSTLHCNEDMFYYFVFNAIQAESAKQKYANPIYSVWYTYRYTDTVICNRPAIYLP